MGKAAIYSSIISCESYIPENKIVNDALPSSLNTNNQWIIERTGIHQRYFSDKSASFMGVSALKSALYAANISGQDIDLLIVATTTPDLTFPSTACLIQKELALSGAACFDVQAACSGFIYAMSIGDKFIKTGSAKIVAIVGTEKMSSIINFKDRNTAILFGDGAGAIIMKAREEEGLTGPKGIIDCQIFSDGNLSDLLKTSAPAASPEIFMQGQEVFKFAVNKMADMVQDILAKNNYNIADIAAIVPHQANYRISAAMAKKLNISEEKVISTIHMYGNTSAASIPMALDYAMKNGRLKSGDLIIIEAVGAGLTWGCALVRL